MVEANESAPNRILDVSFNQDQGCFSVSTDKGFRIFNTYPFKDTFQRELDAGIGMATMLFRSNILALVGGGAHPKYPPNKVILWDDHQMKCIGELSFKSNVKSVRLRKDKIVVVLEQRLYMYQISDLKLLDVIDTFANPQGLCAFSPVDNAVLICPDKKKGYIRIMNIDKNTNTEVKAHESSINAIATNQDGKICATASDKGTLIRIFSTESCKLLEELRRGADKADVQCIAFDKTSQWLACTSDKGTIHIFSLAESHKEIYGEKSADAKNPTSVFKFMKGIIPYFKSEWSFAQFRIPESRSLVAFGPADKFCIIVVTYNGKYYLAEFDPKVGGDCHKLTDKMILEGD